MRLLKKLIFLLVVAASVALGINPVQATGYNTYSENAFRGGGV